MKKQGTEIEYKEFLKLQSDEKELLFAMAQSLDKHNMECGDWDEAVERMADDLETWAESFSLSKMAFWKRMKAKYQLPRALDFKMNNDFTFVAIEADIWNRSQMMAV